MSSTGRGAGSFPRGTALDKIDYIDDVDDPSPQGARASFGQFVRRPAPSGGAARFRPMREVAGVVSEKKAGDPDWSAVSNALVRASARLVEDDMSTGTPRR